MPDRKPEPRRYAEGTEVSAEKSRAELESLLDKHGATEVMFHKDSERTTVVFRKNGVMVRLRVEYPKRADFKKSQQGYVRGEPDITKHCDAEWRRIWRAQLLIVKAKLEMIATGGSTFEREFLADMLLADGQTVVEVALPRIMESYQTGQMPSLLLGSGDGR
jgi:hypothetical protein